MGQNRPSGRGVPGRLWSLWDIMKAIQPERILSTIRNLWIDSGLLPPLGHESRQAFIHRARHDLEECGAICREFNLHVSALKVQKSLEFIDMNGGAHVDIQVLERGMQIISSTVEEEMSLRKYFEVTSDKASYFEDSRHPFDDEGDPTKPAVSVQFPSTVFDAAEASRCYALGRNTACVFHLMRVLEVGLGVLARRFNEPYDHTNWGDIINRLERDIRDIEKAPGRPPDWKDEREFYSQCTSYFRVTNDAWRKYTAHARGKYDEQEALDLFGNVRGFMRKMAMKLSE